MVVEVVHAQRARGAKKSTHRVLSCPENQFRCSVIARTNVSDARLPRYEGFCASKVAQFKDVVFGVHQKVLGFDVPVTDAASVQVGEGAAHLVDVEFHSKHGGKCASFRVEAYDLGHCVGDVLKYQI